jgi:hypothetical protein
MIKKHLWIFVGVVALAGCSGGDSAYKPKEAPKVEPVAIATGEEAKLFPLVVGNKWRYEVERVLIASNGQRQQTKEDVTMEVKEVTDIEGGKRAILELSNKGVATDRQTWDVKADGIYQVQIGLDKPMMFDPPKKVVSFPITPDQEWTYTGKGPTPFGAVGDITSTSLTKAAEEVDTNMDRVSAYRVEDKNKYKVVMPEGLREGEEETQAFWSPNIGLVRYRQSMGAMIDTPADAQGQKGKLGIGSQTTLTLISRTLK